MLRFLKHIRIIGRRNQQDIPIPAELLEREETLPRETLNPEILLQQEDALPAIKQEAEKLAGEYGSGMGMREIFSSISDMFAGLFREYREHAFSKLEDALNVFKSAEMPMVINIDPETEELRTNLKPLAERRLDRIDMLYEKASSAATAFRTLTIGITGNPAILPVVTMFGFAFVLPVVAAITSSMLFEVVFNTPLLQDKANLNVAQMFSVLVSLAGTMTTFMAGRSMRVLLDHKNAETEKHSCFPDGGDPVTSRPAAVLPMAGDATFECRFWHAAMFFVIGTTLIIRYIMASQVGDMAGSAGVLFVFVVLYGWETKYAKVNHPRAKECLVKMVEAETAEADLQALKEDIVSLEAKMGFDAYATNLATREATERKKTEARKQAGNTFLYLANGFLASPSWFTEKFRGILGEAVEVVGSECSETDEELSALTIEVEPEFSTNLHPDLALTEAVATVASISTNVEIRGHRMTTSQFENLLEKLTDELIRERATTKLAIAEEEARRATAKVAIPAPKLTRPRWTPPRLGGKP